MKNNGNYNIPGVGKEGTRFEHSDERLDFHLSHLPHTNIEKGQEAIISALENPHNFSQFDQERRADFGRNIANISEVAERNEKDSVYFYMRRLGENLEQFRRSAQDADPDTNQTLLSEESNANYLNDLGAADNEQIS